MYKNKIQELAREALDVDSLDLVTTENSAFGDYTSNIALINAKAEKLNPRELASSYKDKLEKDQNLGTIVEKIEVAGPGFINFWLKADVLIDTLRQIDADKESYGSVTDNFGKKVVVEYTDPNPFKEFHIGHLMSNVTGEAFAKLREATGAQVWRANYFGDVGVHVAKSIWGIVKMLEEDGITFNDLSQKTLAERINYMGKGYALGTTKFEVDEASKAEINRLNLVLYVVAQKMWKSQGKATSIDYNKEGKVREDEVEKYYEIYVTGRAWSLEYFESIYAILGTKFNGYYPESFVAETGYKYVLDNLGKVFEESEGAVIFRGEKFGLHTRVFINKHNLPTYEAKELGLAPTKYLDYAYDESLIVVGKEIKEYFMVLVEALKQVNPSLGAVTRPICTGMVNLTEGKMSSRKGNVVTVMGLIEKLKELAKLKMSQNYSGVEADEIAQKIAIGALKYAFLKNSVGQDIAFDLEKSLALDGNSGPYIQYVFARTQSVTKNADTLENTLDVATNGNQFQTEELILMRTLAHFPEVVSIASEMLSPNMICNYLFDLAQKYNSFYNKLRIIEDGKVLKTRLAINNATGQVIKNGLALLGIEAPEKM